MEVLWQRGGLQAHERRTHGHLLECQARGDAFGVAWAEVGSLRRVLLLGDNPRQASVLTQHYASRPATSSEDFIRFLSHCGACENAAYARDPIAAREARERLERIARRSVLMMKSPLDAVRVFALGCSGIAAVTEGNAPVGLRFARQLERDRSFGGHLVYGLPIRAGLEVGLAAAEAYDRIAVAVSAEFPMHADAARVRAAEIRGDESGRRRELDALRARGASNPEGLAAMLMPRAPSSGALASSGATSFGKSPLAARAGQG